MPSPKRWFPTSRDLNDDPEIWELTDLFGDRALRTWLEILAILDRVDNSWKLSGQWLAGLSRRTRQKPGSIQRQLGWMVVKGWLTVRETLPDGLPAVYSATNYAKYHRTSELKGNKPVPDTGAKGAPSLPYPNRTEPSSSEGSGVNTVEKRNGRDAGSREKEGFESVWSVVEGFRRLGGL